MTEVERSVAVEASEKVEEKSVIGRFPFKTGTGLIGGVIKRSVRGMGGAYQKN